MLRIAKAGRGLFQLPIPLDIDIKRAVHQNIGDFLVIEERFERTKPDHVVAEVSGERHFFQLIELNTILGRNLVH